jgi:hydrogenase maturation protease
VEEIGSALREWLSGTKGTMVVGVGNPLRRDDYVGRWVVKEMEGKTPKSVLLVECDVFEDSLEQIFDFKPTHILLIDAALTGKGPGSISLKRVDELKELTPLSTHAIPIQAFCEYVVETTGAKVGILAIEPKETGFGEGLTPEVERAAKRLERILLDVLGGHEA